MNNQTHTDWLSVRGVLTAFSLVVSLAGASIAAQAIYVMVWAWQVVR